MHRGGRERDGPGADWQELETNRIGEWAMGGGESLTSSLVEKKKSRSYFWKDDFGGQCAGEERILIMKAG